MRKLLSYSLIGLLLLVIFIASTLLFVSPQKTSPFLDANNQAIENSIAEIRTIELNGVKQRLLIRGKDRSNPILLHVHGGPGGPDQAIVRTSGKTVEDIFTVVYWDQRGAGASYSQSLSPTDLSLAQIVADGIELAKHLSAEFDQQKIYLQGHSWGTLVSINMVSKDPNLFHAYFSIGQIANTKRAESLSYDYTQNAAIQAGDQKTLDALAEIGRPPYEAEQIWLDTVMVERGLMQPYEIPGQTPLFNMFDIYKSFTFYRGYSIKDKLDSLKGSELSMQKLWIEAVNANLFESHPRLEVPIYFFQGKYDQHTVTEVSRDFYEFVQAPHKDYFNFSESAHWPHLREYSKYRNILERIINKS